MFHVPGQLGITLGDVVLEFFLLWVAAVVDVQQFAARARRLAVACATFIDIFGSSPSTVSAGSYNY
ncbi:hypothetical protein RF819_19435 [Rhodoferax fermentans]|uniref:Uncharacterized protein n=1 Tax=Rhodoferax fermentans TaxID=28066 RepID=A0A1T1AWT4_RHOFE|nr:hypothetical protein RF819_19435 [Rhodoferax fermentans]